LPENQLRSKRTLQTQRHPPGNMATAQAANELKQQGALEASRDPNSNVSAEDAERKIVEDSRQAGVTAFIFDPDASPEEKRAQARAVRC
jgi:hypothetical protein